MENNHQDLPPNQHRTRIPATFILVAIGIILLIAAVLLYPEARQQMEQQQIQKTLAEMPPVPSPSQTSTETPSSPPASAQADPQLFAYPSQFGTLVLSLREGTDIHLFAYQPFLEDWSGAGFSGLPLTRLTSGSHQDITPDISPDGRYIAFSSNRNGFWDLYILDLLSGDLQQFTDTPAYDANPSWSPDGQWLVYESYQVDNLEILIQSRDQSSGPIPLTRNSAADYAPDWSGQGRWISFISSRSGQLEVWYADLDSPEEDKAVQITNLPGGTVKHPVWSADGRYLTWSVITQQGNHILTTWDSQHPDSELVYSGTGDWPTWAGSGKLLYAVIEQPSETFLTAYPVSQENPQVMLPAVKLPGRVEGISWVGENAFSWSAELSEGPSPTPLWKPVDRAAAQAAGSGVNLAKLQNLSAPFPEFHPDAVSSFKNLRSATIRAAGWDFLSTLENAYVPLNQPLLPGVNLAWLHTGRALLVNDIPRLAEWLHLVPEPYGSQTYWRVFIRANNQQGSQGRPLRFYAWDFSARLSGNNTAYENGGARTPVVPPGYWVDFTALAEAYGWSRFPAETFWQYSEQAARYQYFAFTQELNLEKALLQLYTEQEIQNLLNDSAP